MLQIYDKLLELPIFLGFSKKDIERIIDTTRLGFQTLDPSATVVKRNEKCRALFFLTDGTLSVESKADDNSYTIIEELSAPAVLQPEHLFGLTQHYSKTFITQTRCNFIYIEKNEVFRLIEEHLIFRLNFFNTLSTVAQKANRLIWKKEPSTIRHRFLYFLRQRCCSPVGKKTLKIKMQTLADEIHESRLNVSKILHELETERLILLSRSQIIIEALEKLK
ncbi:MAG: Crp/Fnr family transcriptional regulator [Prevotella sp.]|nr:Crp/Fnr family transcriptional regulator [Prevotella sp.]MDY4218568.1 Crp/Fnr family transcriptional regulator [Prevotella sp.]